MSSLVDCIYWHLMLVDKKYHHSKILQTVLDVKGLNKCVGEKWNTQKSALGII